MTEKILKRMLQIIFQIIIIAAILFISSGRLDWWMAWAYLSIFVAGVGVNIVLTSVWYRMCGKNVH